MSDTQLKRILIVDTLSDAQLYRDCLLEVDYVEYPAIKTVLIIVESDMQLACLYI